jgi:CheY-like chemotaxis protein
MSKSAKPRLLLVEDSRDARLMYAEQLEHDGFDVVLARDGAEALEQIRERKPDLVLLDLSLPRVSGWDVARRMRDDPDTQPIPILALTAHATRYSLDRAKWSGCDTVLVKPITPLELTRQVRELLGSAKPRPQPIAPQEPGSASRTRLRIAEVRVRRNEDEG